MKYSIIYELLSNSINIKIILKYRYNVCKIMLIIKCNTWNIPENKTKIVIIKISK